jgi:hypothetical protein
MTSWNGDKPVAEFHIKPVTWAGVALISLILWAISVGIIVGAWQYFLRPVVAWMFGG